MELILYIFLVYNVIYPTSGKTWNIIDTYLTYTFKYDESSIAELEFHV